MPSSLDRYGMLIEATTTEYPESAAAAWSEADMKALNACRTTGDLQGAMRTVDEHTARLIASRGVLADDYNVIHQASEAHLRGRKQFARYFPSSDYDDFAILTEHIGNAGFMAVAAISGALVRSVLPRTYAQVFDVEKDPHEMAVVASSFMATMQNQRKPLMLSHVCFDWADKLLTRRATRTKFIEKDLALRDAAAKREHEIRAALKAEAARVKAKTFTPSTGTPLSPLVEGGGFAAAAAADMKPVKP